MCCFSSLRLPGSHFWSLWALFGGTWTHYGRLLAHFGRSLAPLGSHFGCLGGSRASPWLILEPMGFILGCSGHPKVVQSGPGRHLADIVRIDENKCFFMGWRGWRLPSWRQIGILDAVGAHLGCLDCCQGDFHRLSLIESRKSDNLWRPVARESWPQ